MKIYKTMVGFWLLYEKTSYWWYLSLCRPGILDPIAALIVGLRFPRTIEIEIADYFDVAPNADISFKIFRKMETQCLH